MPLLDPKLATALQRVCDLLANGRDPREFRDIALPIFALKWLDDQVTWAKQAGAPTALKLPREARWATVVERSRREEPRAVVLALMVAADENPSFRGLFTDLSVIRQSDGLLAAIVRVVDESGFAVAQRDPRRAALVQIADFFAERYFGWHPPA
jgi:hypothetical protein